MDDTRTTNEDRIKEIIKQTGYKYYKVAVLDDDGGVIGENEVYEWEWNEETANELAHALAVEFAVPACDREPLDVDKIKALQLELLITKQINLDNAKAFLKIQREAEAKLTALKQRIDGITVEDILELMFKGSLEARNNNDYDAEITAQKILNKIHDKIKGV